ncbi:MAG: AAA family ATPase [Janthinobacterium lividum]
MLHDRHSHPHSALASPSIDDEIDEFFRVVEKNSPQVELYTFENIRKLQVEGNLAKDPQDAAVIARLVKELMDRGRMRELTTMREDFRNDLDELKTEFPNFSRVVDYIRGCAEIAWRTDKVLRFTPILLNGPAGVGKTMFAEALATWMNHGFHRISISSSQNGADLAGSSSFFSNAKPGVPFTSLVKSDYANQVIFLDEIDKNSAGQYDALGALYVLLEPATARHYRDLCYDIEIDASHLLYIAASNNVSLVQDALSSRFKIFEIGITKEQSREIATSIAQAALASLLPSTEGITISDAANEQLSCMTPRRIRQAVIEAIGTAFSNDSSLIENIGASDSTTRRMGFL